MSLTGGSVGYGRATATSAAPPPPSGTVRLLIVGDASVTNVATGLQNAKTALGYSSVTLTITTKRLNDSAYTGSDITTANYDCVIFYMNGGLSYAASFGTNLNNYISSGGNIVLAVFTWNIVPSGLTFTNTPLNRNQGGTTGQANGGNGNITLSVVHPITTGLNTAMTNGAATFYNTFLGATDADSTIIATYTSFPAVPAVAVRTSSGGVRTVSINFFGAYVSNYTNLAQLFVQSVLWTRSLIS